MRWIPFAVLLFFFSALQVAHLGALGGVAKYPLIEYLPLLAVFYCLYAPEESAPLAALWCGLVYDLLTPATVGVHAIPLALVGYGVIKIRLNIFREHLISQLIISGFAVLAFGVLTTLGRYLVLKIMGSPLDAFASTRHIGQTAANAVYSGLVAPGIFWLLFRFRGILGLNLHGPRGRGYSN